MKKIQIFGMGCPKCKTLSKNAEQAARELGLEYEIIKTIDINEITRFGVTMMTPALAVDGIIKLVRKVASVDEIKKLLV